jgi:hypothetical protein
MRLMEIVQDYNHLQSFVLTMSNISIVLPEVQFYIVINEINTLGTGDADLRHLRFCVINVKDG